MRDILKLLTQIAQAEFIKGSSIISVIARGAFQLLECFLALHISIELFKCVLIFGLPHVVYVAYCLMGIVILTLIYALGQAREPSSDD